jgi:hypothetical protein
MERKGKMTIKLSTNLLFLNFKFFSLYELLELKKTSKAFNELVNKRNSFKMFSELLKKRIFNFQEIVILELIKLKPLYSLVDFEEALYYFCFYFLKKNRFKIKILTISKFYQQLNECNLLNYLFSVPHDVCSSFPFLKRKHFFPSLHCDIRNFKYLPQNLPNLRKLKVYEIVYANEFFTLFSFIRQNTSITKLYFRNCNLYNSIINSEEMNLSLDMLVNLKHLGLVQVVVDNDILDLLSLCLSKSSVFTKFIFKIIDVNKAGLIIQMPNHQLKLKLSIEDKLFRHIIESLEYQKYEYIFLTNRMMSDRNLRLLIKQMKENKTCETLVFNDKIYKNLNETQKQMLESDFSFIFSENINSNRFIYKLKT